MGRWQVGGILRRRHGGAAEELTVPAATLLKLSLETYWRFWDSGRTDVVEAARLACESYRLARVLLDDEPDDGWADEHLYLAGSFLHVIGDQHAIRSVEWPGGVPEDGRQLPESQRAALRDQGITAWMRRATRGAPHIQDAATWTELYGRLVAGDPPTPDHDLDADTVSELRSKENPSWEYYEKARWDAANGLRTIAQAHAEWYRDLDDAVDADWAFLDLDAERIHIARELAVCDQTTWWLVTNGAEAEACLAIGYATELVRELYLMLNTRSLAEFRDLSIRPPEMAAQDAFDRFLGDWSERVLEGVPPEA